MKKNTNKNDLFGQPNYEQQGKTIVKITIGVILILAVVYFLTALATGEIKFGNKEKETEEVSIQYEEIIAGQILNRMQEEYYVLAFDFTDSNASYYLSLKDSYLQNTDALAFYIVDLEKGFNQAIIVEENEKFKENPETIDELKAKSPTLFKIEKGKVVLRVETEDKVLEELEKLAG